VAKDQQQESAKQQIRDENSGPSRREVELAQINRQLAAEALEVWPVTSDGNCLYRAVAHQLSTLPQLSSYHDHNALRGLAAAHIRAHAEDYSPFLGMEAGDAEFVEYVRKVASLTDAEWGGQLELKALAAALQLPIHVYAADAPLLRMEAGTDTDTASDTASTADAVPLRVAYHRHYFSLGEHYNSTVTASKAGEEEDSLGVGSIALA
jgi:OTU domain-containing protein 6